MRIPLFTIALFTALIAPVWAASPVPVVAVPRQFVDASGDQTGKNLGLSILMGEHVAFRLSAAAVALVRYTDSLPAKSDVRVTAQFEQSRDGRTIALYSEMNSVAVFEVTYPVERFGALLDSLSEWILAKAAPAECTRLDRFMHMQVESSDPKALRESARFCALASSGDRAALMQAAEGALALYDVDALNQVTRFTAAMWLDNAGEWPSAYRKYADQLVVIPEHAGLYAMQARCARRMGNASAALAAARAAEQRNLKTPELLLEGVLALENQGKKEGAYRIVADMMAKDSTCAGCWLFMARWYLDKGEPQLGLAAAERAMGLGAIDRDVVLQQGRALVALKRPAEAEAALLRSTTDPVLAREAWPILAELNAGVGKAAKAMRYYEEAIKADPANLQIYFKAADCAAASGDKAGSLRMLEQARGRFASSAELDRRIALVNLSAGDTSQVVRFLEQSLAKKTDDTASLISLCRVIATREQWPKLQTLSARLLTHAPANVEAIRMLGLAQLRTGDFKASIATLTPTVKKNPADLGTAAILAESWYRMGNVPEAVNLYKRVLVKGAEGALAAGAADAFFAAGDMPLAVKWYDAAGSSATDAVHRLRLIAALSNLRSGDRAARLADSLTAATLPGEPALKAAVALEKNKDMLRAARFYDAALAVGYGREEALTSLLRIEQSEKKYAAAAGRAMALALLDPVRQRDQLFVAGTLYEQATQVAQAVTAYERFLGSGSATVDAVLRLARIKGGLNDQAGVVRCAALVKPSQVNQPADLLLFGNALLAGGRAADALVWFKESTGRFADVAGGWEGLALAAHETGDRKTALAANRRILSIGSGGARNESAWRSGMLLEEGQDLSLALEQYRTNIREFPNDLRNYDRLVDLCRAAHLPVEARDAAVKAAEIAATDPSRLKLVGDLCRELNDQTSAIRYYERAVALRAADGGVRSALGALYFSRGRCDLAAMHYGAADSLTGGTRETALRLGQSLACIGSYEQAAAAFERALVHAGRVLDTAALSGLVAVLRTAGDGVKLESALRRQADAGISVYAAAYEAADLCLARADAQAAATWLERACKVAPDSVAPHMRLSSVYLRLQNRTAAFSHLQRASLLAPADPSVAALLAVWHIRNRQFAAADEILARIPAHFSNPDVRFARSLRSYEQGDFAAADAVARELANELSYVASYRAMGALAAAGVGDSAAAIDGAERAVALDKNDPFILADAGRALVHAGRISAGTTLLNNALIIDRKNFPALEGLGDAAWLTDRYAVAAGFYQSAKKAGDNAVDMRLGRTYAVMNQPEKANAVFATILAKDPNNREACYRLLSTLRRDSVAFRTQFAVYEATIRTGNDRTIWDHLVDGLRFEMEGNLDAAQIGYDVTLRLAPDMPDAVAGRGRVFLGRGMSMEAVEELGRAFAADQYNPHLILDLAQAFDGADNIDAAMSLTRSVTERFPSVSLGWHRYALLLGRNGDHGSAVAAAAMAVSLDKKNPGYLYTLGAERTLAGDPEGAIKAYTLAAKFGGSDYLSAWAAIAFIYRDVYKDPAKVAKITAKYASEGGDASVLTASDTSQ